MKKSPQPLAEGLKSVQRISAATEKVIKALESVPGLTCKERVQVLIALAAHGSLTDLFAGKHSPPDRKLKLLRPPKVK